MLFLPLGKFHSSTESVALDAVGDILLSLGYEAQTMRALRGLSWGALFFSVAPDRSFLAIASCKRAGATPCPPLLSASGYGDRGLDYPRFPKTTGRMRAPAQTID